MYERNPGEMDFGSSKHEVRVSEGSSYRESTVFLIGSLVTTDNEVDDLWKYQNANNLCLTTSATIIWAFSYNT